MTAETLALIAGAFLTLIFSYVPGLNVKFGALASETKRLIMLGLIVLVGAVSFLLACTGFGEGLGITLVCTQGGLIELIKAIVFAAVANQGLYQLTPDTAGVAEAKAARTEG
jgi:hypothetical protein